MQLHVNGQHDLQVGRLPDWFLFMGLFIIGCAFVPSINPKVML
jgi:hypothetical protein